MINSECFYDEYLVRNKKTRTYVMSLLMKLKILEMSSITNMYELY